MLQQLSAKKGETNVDLIVLIAKGMLFKGILGKRILRYIN